MQANKILEVPRLVQVGAFGRNDGKTTLACAVISQLCQTVPVIAAKLVCVEAHTGACHKPGGGCGLCSCLQGDYDWQRETDLNTKKDTALMKKAGASESYLLRSHTNKMAEAFADFLETQVPDNAVLVCESNRLRYAVKPGVFLFAAESLPPVSAVKPQAHALCKLSDLVVVRGEKAPKLSVQINADLCPCISLARL